MKGEENGGKNIQKTTTKKTNKQTKKKKKKKKTKKKKKKINRPACALSEVLNQSAHPRDVNSSRRAELLRVVKDLSKRRHADSEDSDQSVCLHRLVFQGCTCSFIRNTVPRFKLACDVF